MTTVGDGKFSWKALRAETIDAFDPDHLPKSIELPALPHAVSEFVEKAANPDFDIKVLSAIVERDSGLTVELLKHVNSASYALRAPVRSVKDAVMHIGINAAKMYLLAAGMRAASRAIKSKLINQRNFWNESLQRALFARELARKLKLDSGLAFLGGLLQDFLLPVLTNHFDGDYISYMSTDFMDGRDLCDWEQERFGWNHASAGAYCAARWHFPDDLLCAIHFHHSLNTTLEPRGPEFFKLFPVAMSGLLPDQLRQTQYGFRELIQVDKRSASIGLEEICRVVDEEQMRLAEGYEIPNHLSNVLADTRRKMALDSAMAG
ncbi:MAG: HDOD domain-containing protein [Planctomycetaceae bacterium]